MPLNDQWGKVRVSAPPARLVYAHVTGPRFESTVTFDNVVGETVLTM